MAAVCSAVRLTATALLLLPSVAGALLVPAPPTARCCIVNLAKPKKPAVSSKGFGAKPTVSSKAGPTPAEQLRRSQAVYAAIEKGRLQRAEIEAAELLDEEDDHASAASTEQGTSYTKYAVTLRTDAAAEFSDWVPVALLALETGHATDPTALVPSAVGATCVPILEAACQSFPALRKVDRSLLQYSFEPLDEFDTHVNQGLHGRAERRRKAEETLGLERGGSEDPAALKRAHRRILQLSHPDKFVDDPSGAEAAREQMLAAQDAYAELGGGQGVASSWYEALGGKARVSFSGALSKAALGKLGHQRAEQKLPLEQGGWRAGAYPFDVDLAREFAARNGQRTTRGQKGPS